MEISAISAVSPKDIDWRRLTAKEIIKYENEGVEVPDEYLQWAKDFQNDLKTADTDDTTYETAAAASANAGTQTQGDTASDESENTEEEPQNLTAAQRRDKMFESGEGYLKVARTFSAESKVKAKESLVAEAALSETGAKSDSETESLEASISSLMEQADELKSQIESLKNKSSKDNNLGNVAKILQLQRQLKQLGASGQALAAGTDADLNEYKSVIDSQSSIGADSVDTGNVTVEMGEEVKRWGNIIYTLIYRSIGKRIIKNGKNAIEKGDVAQQSADDVSSRNSQNLSRVSKAQNEIFAKTGAQAVSFKDDEAQSKDVKNEEDKGSQENKIEENQQAAIASGNIDEIMKYKMRKGEDVNPELS